MTRVEVLKMLIEIFGSAVNHHTEPDDPSGCLTITNVDHEVLMRRLNRELRKEQGYLG